MNVNLYIKLFSGFILALSLSLCSVTVYAGSKAVVNSSDVNIRKSAGTDSEIIGTLNANESVTVVDTDGEWFRIVISSGEAFVKCDYLDIFEAEALVSGSGVNVRKDASIYSDAIGKLNVGDTIFVESMCGDFYRFGFNGIKAYIHKDFVVSPMLAYLPSIHAEESPSPPPAGNVFSGGELYGVVISSDGLNLRIGPGVDYDAMCTIPPGNTVEPVESVNGWTKVTYRSYTGFVKSEYLELRSGESAQSDLGAQIAAFGLKYLGTPYQWAGTSLEKGVDCSGFTYAVYKSFGISLNRRSSDQLGDGTKISKNELTAGDLVFFSTDGSGVNISHVGIYIGNGEFVHATSSRSYCVAVSSLYEDYYQRNYVAACRVVR